MMEKGLIGAWYQGGSEIGPRALGHRSIIATPKYRENLNVINNTIKHRENWRPLAPSLPQELFYEVFDTNSMDLTEFMLRTVVIKPEWRKKLIAVCHIDNTTRPQTVRREDNPEYYDLIMDNYKLTGIPAIINTSFNGKGEPIIETPQQAMAFMDRTPNMNFIVFNAKYIITRKDSNV
jgi:carbamoyltransferase